MNINKRKDIRGVTLIEILVTLVIAGIVIGAIYQIYLAIQRQGVAQEEIADMQQNTRIAADQITKELRQAGYNGETPIMGIVGSINSLTITLDANNTDKWVMLRGDFDGSNDGVYEEATYAVNASSMLRRCYRLSNNPNPCEWEDFVPNIQSVVFSFYNDQNSAVNVNTNTVAPPAAAVRRVAVTITGKTKEHEASTPIGKLWASSPNPNSPTKYKTAQLNSDGVLRNFGGAASDTVAPNCPTSIAVSATGNCGELQVTWQWTDKTPPEGDLGGFLIYYQAANGLDTGTMTVSDPSARSAFLQNRQNGISYSIDVRAFDRYFNKNSTCASPFPAATPTNSSIPTPPDGFQAAPGNNKVTLSWNPIDTSIAANRDVKGYRLYRGTTPDFVPGSTNIIACEKIKTGDAAIAGCTNNILSTPDAAAGWFSVTSFDDTTAVNCTKYYYKIRSVDQCLVESADSVTVNATPPDNDKKPNTPVITFLEAGDDTSSIILRWILSYDPNDTTHSPPEIFRVFYKRSDGALIPGCLTSPWCQWGSDIPITLAGGAQTISGPETIINGLATNTTYDVKVSAYDSSANCSNESDVTASNTGSISTAACAPKIRWTTQQGVTRGGHFIFPGITTTGQSLANFDQVGTDPGTVANSRFLTWIADPLDCTPDSSNYDRNGFDYNNPPSYTTVSPNARVEFYINSHGSLTDTAANIPYNFTGITQFVDSAPRSDDGYYHWPVYPLNPVHIDTTRLCNGLKDFLIRAVDGENYTAENTIILEIKDGGIEQNSSQATISNITTPNDFHNQVIFGLRNSSTVKDLKITKMALSWTNTLVNLKKIAVFNSSDVLIGLFEDTILPIDTTSGAEVTLTTIPTIPSGSTATVRVTFTGVLGLVPSATDMRGKTVTLDKVTFQDSADSGFVCAATSLASLNLSSEPAAGGVVQDQPASNTSARTTTDIIVPANTSVKVSLPISDISATVGPVRLRFNVDTFGSSTAPTRPSNLTDLGNYPNLVAMALDIGTGLWNGTIPANNNARIWYYIEAKDNTGNFDITPDTGAYTYAQCGTTPPTVTFVPPTPDNNTNVNNVVTIEVTASSIPGIANVFFDTDPANSALIIPPTLMTQISPGVWEGSYNATAGNLHHVLRVTATDNCGNKNTPTSPTSQRTFN